MWPVDQAVSDVVVLPDRGRDQEGSRGAGDSIVMMVSSIFGHLVRGDAGVGGRLHFSNPKYARGCFARFSEGMKRGTDLVVTHTGWSFGV